MVVDYWYYYQDGQQFGPIPEKELLELAKSGRLSQDDFVWKEGFEDWVMAGEVEGLFPATAGPSGQELLVEFIHALDEEIEAIKAGRGGSIVRIFDGRFIREDAGISVYSFMLENFIAAMDDAPVEVEIGKSRWKGHIIQMQGLEVVVGVEHNLGEHIPQARLITNLYFLHQLLKKKFEAIRDGEASANFALANLVFQGNFPYTAEVVELPPLEPHPDHPEEPPNHSQMEAIKVSQQLPLSFVWGPPGTGKTETLARIVECFVKRGMRVLVVAHSNAAVDEAAEDIAEILQLTEYYNKGQIIRLGNWQKDTFKKKYDLLLLDNIAERLGTTLRKEKEQLERQNEEIKQSMEQLASVLQGVKERGTLASQETQLSAALKANLEQASETAKRLEQEKTQFSEMRIRLQKAESSGALKRFFLGLNPVKIRHEIDQKSVLLDSIRRQSEQIDLQRKDIERRRSETESRLSEVQETLQSVLDDLGVSESEVRGRVEESNAQKKKILARIGEIEDELNEIQRRVLSEAKVIATTLTKTFSAKELPDTPFDVLILDEASMAPMPYLYWALGRCRKAAIIIGDFMQLPPICIAEDKNYAKNWLGRSIYDQLGVNEDSVHKDIRVCMLRRQYRMNPAISAIANQLFYGKKLKNDASTQKHCVSDGLSENPLTIIDTSSASPWCARLLSRSGRFNVYSALVAATIAKKASTAKKTFENNKECTIGITTPYVAQARLIKRMVQDMKLDPRERKFRVANIHRFQGGEEDIIIFDTTEGPGVRVAPMIDDTRDKKARLLLNVAMTRAKCKVFLIANVEYLKEQLPPESALYKIITHFEEKGERIYSTDLVDTYFKSDFEKWVNILLETPRERLLTEIPTGSFATEKDFFPRFFADLRDAKEEVIIVSPFIAKKRAGKLVEFFRSLVSKEVKIKIVTRPPKEQEGSLFAESEEMIRQFEAVGVQVFQRRRYRRRQLHEKLAIIDRKIVWFGTLNILSYSSTSEKMLRLPFKESVKELMKLCELDRLEQGEFQGTQEPIKTFEACPESGCEREMVIRVGPYGAFLSCPKRSCPGKRNIKRWERIITQTLCPECGAPMVLRRGKRGPFLGCSRYPECKKTMSLY